MAKEQAKHGWRRGCFKKVCQSWPDSLSERERGLLARFWTSFTGKKRPKQQQKQQRRLAVRFSSHSIPYGSCLNPQVQRTKYRSITRLCQPLTSSAPVLGCDNYGICRILILLMNELCKMDWYSTKLTFILGNLLSYQLLYFTFDLAYSLLVCALPVILAQEPEVYNGKFLGKFNSYHHQVCICLKLNSYF